MKETLKAGSSLRGDGYILLRMKKPAPQQNNTPIISSTLSQKKGTSQSFGVIDTHTYLSNDSKKSLLLMLLTVDKSVNIDIVITRCDVEAKLCIAVQTGKAIN